MSPQPNIGAAGELMLGTIAQAGAEAGGGGAAVVEGRGPRGGRLCQPSAEVLSACVWTAVPVPVPRG